MGTGWESVMRIRVSQGWHIKHFFGHMQTRGIDLLTIPNCHEDYSLGFTIEMEENVSVVEPQLHVQVALLYTNQQGERRIRVLTHALTASSQHHELVASVKPEATSAVLSMMATDRALRTGLSDARAYLSAAVTQAVVSNSAALQGSQQQGQQTADSTSPFRFLPLYVFGLLKSTVMRPGADLGADRRMSAWCRLATLPADKVAAFFKPRLLPIHDLQPGEGELDPNTNCVTLPQPLALSLQSLSTAGAYVVDNGQEAVVFIGEDCDSHWVQEVFGTTGGVHAIPPANVTTEEVVLAPTGTVTQERVLNILEAVRQDGGAPWVTIRVTVQKRLDDAERRFFELLIEDKGSQTGWSYPEFEARMRQSRP